MVRWDLLSQANRTIWHPWPRAVGCAPVAARQEPTSLPERVLNTILEARAPSTRRLYALKAAFTLQVLMTNSDFVTISDFLDDVLTFLLKVTRIGGGSRDPSTAMHA